MGVERFVLLQLVTHLHHFLRNFTDAMTLRDAILL